MPFINPDDARRIRQAVQIVESQILSKDPSSPADRTYAALQALQKVRVTGDPPVTSASGIDYYPAFTQMNDPECSEWLDHAECWVTDPNQLPVAAGICLGQESGTYLGLPVLVPAMAGSASASGGGLGSGQGELWCNSTVAAGVLTLEDQEGIPSIVHLATAVFRCNFDVTYRSPRSFNWAGSAVGTTLLEVSRTADSVTVEAASGLDPAEWGINVRGHVGTPGSGSGPGDGGDSGPSGTYPTGGGATCEEAAELTPDAVYGPYSASFPDHWWFKFPVTGGLAYHVTVTHISGGLPAVNVWEGACGGQTLKLTLTPTECDSATAVSTGFAYVEVFAGADCAYTVEVGEGPC